MEMSMQTFKNQMAVIFRDTYNSFKTGLENIPFHPSLKHDALKHLDIGFLLLREAIMLAEIVIQKVEAPTATNTQNAPTDDPNAPIAPGEPNPNTPKDECDPVPPQEQNSNQEIA